jgi:type IV pilus assembly protein PilM
LPPAEEYDPDNPPPSVVVLSMGTETTDLVVTNGFRVWQRSIPLGGNHFTKQLMKELK